MTDEAPDKRSPRWWIVAIALLFMIAVPLLCAWRFFFDDWVGSGMGNQ